MNSAGRTGASSIWKERVFVSIRVPCGANLEEASARRTFVTVMILPQIPFYVKNVFLRWAFLRRSQIFASYDFSARVSISSAFVTAHSN